MPRDMGFMTDLQKCDAYILHKYLCKIILPLMLSHWNVIVGLTYSSLDAFTEFRKEDRYTWDMSHTS